MKRLFVTCLAVSVLLCLLLVPTAATENTFRAGFGQVDITPAADSGLPLVRYTVEDVLLKDVDENSKLYASCVAVTDAQNTTALFLSVDTVNSNQGWSNRVKSGIIEAYPEINEDRIYINATGTRSAPEAVYSGDDKETMDPLVKEYCKMLIDACVEAADLAMQDRSTATMQVGDVDVSATLADQLGVTDGDITTRMNYHAHYNATKDGVTQVCGDGFGPGVLNNSSYTVEEVATPSDKLGLIRFVLADGNKAPIVLANWNAKPDLSSTGYTRYGIENRGVASADYVGYFRDALDYGVDAQGAVLTGAKQNRTLFLQGASGNVNAFSLVKAKRNTAVMEDVSYTEIVEDVPTEKSEKSVVPSLYGKTLAAVAAHGLTQLDTTDVSGNIESLKVRFATEPVLPTDGEVALINELKSSDPVSVDNGDGTIAEYANLFKYMIFSTDNLQEAKANRVTVENGFSQAAVEALAGMKAAVELSGAGTRMAHTFNTKEVLDAEGNVTEILKTSTNFATAAVHCNVSILHIGDTEFSMAPAELYCNYGEVSTGGEISKNWNSVGVDFILGNTDGASGSLPDMGSYRYNAGSDTYFEGTTITQSTRFPEGAGERLMETYVNMQKTLHAEDAQIKNQCECGAKAEEFESKVLPGHTHELKAFLPWYDPDSFPVDGNYYLETNLVLYQEARTGTGHKSIDLNDHTITRKVLPELTLDTTLEEIPADHYYKQTRMFAMETNARLTITDTVGGGKLTRDISALDAVSTEEQKKITNYGLLIAIIDGNTHHHAVYKADLYATDQYSCGGACVANMSAKATFSLYEGTINGGISDAGSAIYNSGTTNLYGGIIQGGQALDSADEENDAENNGNVYVNGSGKLLLAGDTIVQGGTDADGKENNIYVRGDATLTLDPGYTGTAGVTVPAEEAKWNGTVFGKVGEGTTDELLETKLTVDNDENGEYNITSCHTGKCTTISCQDALMAAKLRNVCECGGLTGLSGHTCGESLKWKPWPYTQSLPNGDFGGSFYLLENVTLKSQKNVVSDMHLDLNGHSVTHKVNPTAENWERDTRVFYVGTHQNPGVGSLTITDTIGGGRITRDLSALTEEQQKDIDNYGIMMLVSQFADDPSTIYGGILDGSGQYTGGGAVSNLSNTSVLSVYGGQIKGGISNNAAGLYAAGPVQLLGGTITGGQGIENGFGGVYITYLPQSDALSRPESMGSLVLGGNATVTGNTNKNGDPSNICVKIGKTGVQSHDQFTVRGAYTGTAGVTLLEKPYDMMKVALSDDADISAATLTSDNYPGVKFQVANGYVVVDLSGLAAYITAEDASLSYYETLQKAFTAYPGGKATITMLKSVAEDNLEIGKNTYLNLRGCNVANATSFNGNGNTLYVYDTETDDYTVKVGEELTGYGMMTGAIAEAAQGVELDTELVGVTGKMDHYLKITENGDTSFHRLNLRMVNIVVQPDSYGDESYCPGQYYKAQFGGDEKVKANITHYGVGMAALKEPTFENPLSYTAFNAASWQCGKDAAGDSLNLAGSSQLTGILKPTNTYSINSRNAHYQIYGQAYVRLADGTTLVKGPAVHYSFREMLQGREGFDGVDDVWKTLEEVNKTAAVKMFNQFSQLMRGWDIPNIIKAAGYVRPTPAE